MNQYRPSSFNILPPVVKNLIIINVLFFLATYVLESVYQIDLTKYLGLYYFESEYFKPYQIITHMFMHGSLTHLFFNMFALWMFGKTIEMVWGAKRFLIYYFVTGLGAVALHTFVNWWSLSSMVEAANAFANTPSPDLLSTFIKNHFANVNPQVYDFIADWSRNAKDPARIEQAIQMTKEMTTIKMDIPTVGASGAVFGILLAFGMLFPNVMLYIYFAIPIKAKWFVMIYGGIELYLGVMNQAGDNVAHFAHLGGMIFGFFLIKYWQRNEFDNHLID